jgi:hypothetical protein
MTRSIAFIVALAACHDLPPIDRGVCGNRVIEIGEDCDAGEATPACIACRFACSTADIIAGAPSSCPTGYVCGVDDTCAAPSGYLRPGQATAGMGDADPIAIGDVDGDLIGDLVGARPPLHEVVIRPGSQAGDLSAITRRHMPSGGRPLFDFVDDRGAPYPTLDTVLPIAGGVVTYVGVAGGWAQFPHASAAVPFDADSDVATATVLDGFGFPFEVLVVGKQSSGFAVGMLSGGGLSLCGQMPTTGKLIGGIATARAALSVVEWFAVAHSEVVCVYAYHQGAWQMIPVSLGAGQVLLDEGTPVLGDAGFADNCPDLYLPVTNNGLRTTAVVTFAPGGPYGCQPTGPATVPFPDNPALVLDAVDMNDDGTDELISDGGIPFVGPLPRTWTHADAIDVNRDGLVDVVGIVAGEYGVDVLIASIYGGGLLVVTPFRIDTFGAVKSFGTGDFDGDGFGDIVIFDLMPELAPVSPDLATQWVSYGKPDGGPGDVVFTGAYTGFLSSTRIDTGIAGEGLDAANDLVVVNRDPGGTYVSLGFGRSDRTFVSPLLVDRMSSSATLFAGQLDGADGIDLAGWFMPVFDFGDPLPLVPTPWYATADPYGHLGSVADPSQLPMMARYAVLPRASGDVVIAIEPSPSEPHVIQAFVDGGTTRSAPVALQHAVEGFAVADVDGDGTSDLLAAGTTPTLVRVSDDMVVSSATLDDARLAGCTDFEAIDLGATYNDATVVASVIGWCDGTLRAVYFTGADAYQVRDLAFEVKPGKLAVGDVDGDWIDDVVVHDPASQQTWLYRQCPSRDTTECLERTDVEVR